MLACDSVQVWHLWPRSLFELDTTAANSTKSAHFLEMCQMYLYVRYDELSEAVPPEPWNEISVICIRSHGNVTSDKQNIPIIWGLRSKSSRLSTSRSDFDDDSKRPWRQIPALSERTWSLITDSAAGLAAETSKRWGGDSARPPVFPGGCCSASGSK